DPCACFYYPGLVRALSGWERVGLLCTYKALRRDLPLYGGRAAWVSANIRRYGEHGPRGNLIAVLPGWETSAAEVQAQIRQATSAAIAGYILSTVRLDQSFRPVRSPGM